MSVADMSPKIYSGATVKDCEFFRGGAVIGEDTYADRCEFGKNVRVNRRNFLVNVIFGDYSYTGHNTTIKYAQIGKYSSISWDVSIGGANHDYNRISTHPFYFLPAFGFCEDRGEYESFSEKLIIGNDVWIGSGVQVLRGVNIGNGAVIGAGSVVTKDIPPYAIAVGNPARVLRYRFSDDIIEKLEQMKWWDWDDNTVKASISAFRENVTLDMLIQLESKVGKGNE